VHYAGKAAAKLPHSKFHFAFAFWATTRPRGVGSSTTETKLLVLVAGRLRERFSWRSWRRASGLIRRDLLAVEVADFLSAVGASAVAKSRSMRHLLHFQAGFVACVDPIT